MARILIIEDNQVTCELIHGLLVDFFNKYNLECKIDLATDGVTGLQKVKENTYDLVVADIMMPKVSGKDIVKYLRSSESLMPDIPVIVVSSDLSRLTNAPDVDDLEQVFFIEKPIQSKGLINMVIMVLKSHFVSSA